MARKKGQIYSAEKKVKLVLELLKEEQTVSQLASKYQIISKTSTNWKKQFLENATIENPKLLTDIAKEVGNQSVVVVIEKVKQLIDIPMTIVDGTSLLYTIRKLIEKFGITGCSAGSFYARK